MRKLLKYLQSIGGLLLLWVNCYSWAQSERITPADCVKVKYVSGVWVSTNGKRVAYLVKAPNIAKNRNEYQLYVKNLDDKTLSHGKLLTSGVDISDVKWLKNDGNIAMLMVVAGAKKLFIVDVATGVRKLAFETADDIASYSLDSSGGTVAYSVVNSEINKHDESGPTREEVESGYRITYGDIEKMPISYPSKSIYIRHRTVGGGWSSPQAISIESPFTHSKSTHLTLARNLSMSPNGKKLFLTYVATTLPEQWKQNPYIKVFVSSSGLFEIMVLYDLNTGRTKLAFNMIAPQTVPLWSSDSRSFLMNSASPVGSIWEAEDIRDHRTSILDVNLFEVNAESGEVSEVLRQVPEHHEGPLFWRSDGDVMVHTSGTTVARVHRFMDSWREVGQVTVPKEVDTDIFGQLASNGTSILGVHTNISAPDDLFVYDSGQVSIRLITDLNPQIRDLRLAPVEIVRWMTTGGLNISGLLFKPPDYVPGKRYPLVVQTKGQSGVFACDSGYNHDPAFAPQPMASAGMMYLARYNGEDYINEYKDQQKTLPKGYPGGIGEAIQQMEIWEDAVAMLDKRGMVDPTKVGIIGFSRTGWHVEFDLVHSKIRYAAATAADSVQYSLSEYWLLPGFATSVERMYGGPPYGKSFEAWQKYSISFNLDKMHTPLLMEQMGYGSGQAHGEVPGALAPRYEIKNGLTRLGKPVEMYYYPDDVHTPDHPRARLATLQRNVDWYRFWLQGYEDRDPSKQEQYQRWRSLRCLHQRDIEAEGQASQPDLANSLSQR